ncbi:uncharacterized protein Dvir_GJ26612 [Drosophila virilis]|uniref:Secreted protein n=1 Tax=Drosophila virilis TaxID=7244 RepID=A0A0Q9WW27_DROVI|nr:uncharacterized protein LOC26531382 [Drosophila virilis]KRF85182.1 uncharacterized protein Dvir_GJ26612 [Drosophila virilis]
MGYLSLLLFVGICSIWLTEGQQLDNSTALISQTKTEPRTALFGALAMETSLFVGFKKNLEMSKSDIVKCEGPLEKGLNILIKKIEELIISCEAIINSCVVICGLSAMAQIPMMVIKIVDTMFCTANLPPVSPCRKKVITNLNDNLNRCKVDLTNNN